MYPSCFCFLSAYFLLLPIYCFETVSDSDGPMVAVCATLIFCVVEIVVMTAGVRFLFFIHAVT